MIGAQKKLVVALFLPFVSLVLLAAYQQAQVSLGTEVTLPIRGYDPRDLLSGHYLTFTVDYDLPDLCKKKGKNSEVYVCLNPRFDSTSVPADCSLFIRGKCKWQRFEAGIERYYVPEKDALKLEALVRNQQGSIVLSVGRDGTARVKELLLDNKPWKQVELGETSH